MQAWRALHEEAELDPHHRENLIRDSILKAELDVDLLGEIYFLLLLGFYANVFD